MTKTIPILTLLVALQSRVAQAENEEARPSPHWKAGVATAKITPERRMHMAGYDARKEPAEGTEQDLLAKALAIEDGEGNRVVFITLDLIGVIAELRTAVAEQVQEKYGLPHHALLMNASHTHCGPDYEREDAKDYLDSLTETLVQLVGQTLDRLEPARLSYSFARCGFAMNRRTPTEAAHPNAVAVASAAEPASGNRPNILFLFSDDQRADTIAAWGNPHIQTPNLDAVARSGCSFRGNYCFGGNSGAVCVPSRAMLHTGRNWFHVQNDMSDAETLGSLLGQNGYTTFGIGKWHNGPHSFLRSFRRGKAVFFGGMWDHTKVPLVDLVDGQLVNFRIAEKFSSESFADAAVEFLQSYRGQAPFFCYVALTAPHDPRQPPLPYRQMYYEKRPPLPPNFLPQHPFDNGYMAGGRDEELAPWPRTRQVIRDQLAEYYGMITHMDEQIGRILEALKESVQADNTYVIFASDQGLAQGSHGLLGKQSVYEHSMRSPLIIVGPGVPAGKSTEAFTYLLDLYPTICGLTGVTPPAGLDGHDLAPLCTGQREHVRDSIFLPYQDIMRAVRDRRWKLIQYPEINHTHLFEL